ncbi:hypothetical protein P1X15_17275 [Runella sp. MFBS21]|uniref:Ig-like domain-containing protein n=1 Tax=Runella sp. MFBS21 TaxID=3034018 RepID=UPI0023F62EBA|nr:hypothetical protein [Runella sp. MFBS21]MDF7819373.1 hypothetical protein [Runella sp. MFBS21]
MKRIIPIICRCAFLIILILLRTYNVSNAQNCGCEAEKVNSNGSFENWSGGTHGAPDFPDVFFGDEQPLPLNIPNWVVTRNNTNEGYFNGSIFRNNGSRYVPQDGNTFFGGYVPSINSGAGFHASSIIKTSFNVVAGKEYTLCFHMAPGGKIVCNASGTPLAWVDIPTEGGWTVSMTGAHSYNNYFASNPNDATTDHTLPNPRNWTKQVVSFVANSTGSVELSFLATADRSVIFQGAIWAFFLDNVSVAPNTCTPTCTPPTPTGVGAARCNPGSLTLTASGCDATHPAVWYSDAALATQVGTGNSFTTPNISTTTNYYVACVKDASCKSEGVLVSATINTKPNAGTDQTLACANPTTNTLTTSTTLTGAPSGGSWVAQAGNPATATVTGNGAVSGMTVAGTYHFIYSVGECADTVAVTVQACTPCTKPNAGTDTRICAPLSSTNLTGFSPSGGTWTAAAGNPAAATITNTGAISGATANGVYHFIYSVTSGGQTCSDTVAVTRGNVAVDISGPSTVCGNDLPVQFTATPAGGTFTLPNGLPTGTITTNGNVLTLNPVSNISSITFSYKVTVNGCEGTGSHEVTINNGGPKVNITADTLCVNQTSTYNDPSGTNGTWSGPGVTDTGTAGSLNAANALTALGKTAPVGFYIYYTQTSGSCSRKDSAFVYVNPRPTVTIAGPSALCSSELPVTYTATPANGSFSLPAGLPTGAVTQNANTLTIHSGFGISSITFSYAYTDPATTCSATTSKSVTITSKSNAGADKTLACNAGNLVTTTSLTGSPSGGTWTAQSGNPAAATVTNAGVVSGMTVAGTYKFIYTVNQGCGDTVSVTVQACTGCTKPNAGSDKTLACNAGNLVTTTTLSATPSEGTWTAQSGNPAAATVTNAGVVSGMTVAGTYKFIYSVTAGGQTCSDTVAITVEACAGCTKPNAGSDVSICAPATTAKLTAVTAGGTWSPIGSPANPATATINSSGNVSGLTANGIYRFVYTVSAGGQTCTDTAQVIRNAKPNAGADILSTNAICTTVGTAQLSGSPAGGAWSQLGTSPSVATIAPSGSVSGMTTVGIYQFIYSLNGCIDTVAVETKSCVSPEVDLALKKSINKKIAKLGDTLTYTIQVFNQSSTGATGVEVVDSIATTVGFIPGSFVASRGSATITNNVIKWIIGNIAANSGNNGDTVTLTYRIKVTQQGVHFNTAEISKVNEKDVDSTPNNDKEGEDDIDRQCFTVPIGLCEGEQLEIKIPAHYTNVVWYKEGSTTAVATGNIVLLGEAGIYTFTATNQACPAGGCCPVIIEEGTNCCPTDICIPVTIKKKKMK